MDLGLYIAATGHGRRADPPGSALERPRERLDPRLQARRSPRSTASARCCSPTREGGVPVGSSDAGVALGKTYTDLTPGLDPGNRRTARLRDRRARASSRCRPRRASATPATASSRAPPQGVLTDAERQPRPRPVRRARSRSAPTATLPASAVGVFELSGAEKQGENLYAGSRGRQGRGRRPPGRARGLRRRRGQGDGRDDQLAAQLPVRPAGDPGDRPDAAAGLHAGRLARQRRLAPAPVAAQRSGSRRSPAVPITERKAGSPGG